MKKITKLDKKRADIIRVPFVAPDNFDLYFNSETFTKEDILKRIIGYFQKCMQTDVIPTMSGIALAVGVSRQSLLSTMRFDPELKDVVEYAITWLVDYVEQLLLAGKPPVGLIFWLKNNANWIDKVVTETAQRSASDIIEELEREGTIINGNVISEEDIDVEKKEEREEEDITSTSFSTAFGN